VLGHWRQQSFDGELMAPSLSTALQPVSSVTVASLRDLGWNIEPEAYEEFQLPASVLSGRVAPRVVASSVASGATFDGDLLLPTTMIMPGGRVVHLDQHGRPVFR
jgi:hypothetical protein